MRPQAWRSAERPWYFLDTEAPSKKGLCARSPPKASHSKMIRLPQDQHFLAIETKRPPKNFLRDIVRRPSICAGRYSLEASPRAWLCNPEICAECRGRLWAAVKTPRMCRQY